MKKPIFLFLSLLILGGGYYAFKTYNKKHINVAETKAFIKITAADLFNEFDSNETEAMNKYADKIVEVMGQVTSTDLSNAKEPQLLLKGNGDNGFIRCGFKPEELEKMNNLDTKTILLKGECKGMNSAEDLDLLADVDVVLSKCIIIED